MIPASDATLLWDKLQNMLSISEQLFSPSLVEKVILGNRLWPYNISRKLPKWSLLQLLICSQLMLKSPAIKSSWLPSFSVAIIGSKSVTHVVTFCSLLLSYGGRYIFPTTNFFPISMSLTVTKRLPHIGESFLTSITDVLYLEFTSVINPPWELHRLPWEMQV